MCVHGFRSLLSALGGVFLIVGGIVPRADAQLAAYFNFEDTTTGHNIGGMGGDIPHSQPPAINTGSAFPLEVMVSGLPQPTSVQGVDANVAPGDLAPNLHGMGFVTTTGGTATISFTVPTTGLTNLALSFAVNNNGNGFSTATASFSSSAGGTGSLTQTIHTGDKVTVTFDFSSFTSLTQTPNNQPSVTFSVVFSGGTSMGSNLQTIVDNIQLKVVPEPATTAGGILGVLGLCWFQRRRLIRFFLPRRNRAEPVRLRRA